MQNVVSLRSDRPRPQRAFGVPPSGARILFFTGVRYCRDGHDDGDGAGRDDGAEFAEPHGLHRSSASGRMLDAASH